MKSLFAFLLLFPLAAWTAPLRLALNWKPEPQFGGFYEADHEGLFKKAGLEVTVLPGGSGTPTIQMLAAGQTEYAIVSADEVVLAHDRGARDIVALFATYQTNPQGIMAHAEKNYASLDDLLKDSKSTLLWQAGLPYALYLKKTKKDFAIKTAPYLGGIANFQKDPNVAQQCFITSEPLTAKKAGIKTKVFLVADAGYNPYTTVLVTKASRLKSNPEEVGKMVAAVREGWTRYVKDPKKTNAFMQSLNKAMDLETFQDSAAAQVDLIQTAETKAKGLGVMSEERWKTLVDQLSELKLIRKKISPQDLFKN
jgi:NitT/TauT family transport system substrate-binding protein